MAAAYLSSSDEMHGTLKARRLVSGTTMSLPCGLLINRPLEQLIDVRHEIGESQILHGWEVHAVLTNLRSAIRPDRVTGLT
jgi:hypothetical protein